MDDKIIVTNRLALVRKYGSKGLVAIRAALAALKTADKKRGINSRVVYLDDKGNMKKLGGAAVANAASPRENKVAIDAVFKAINPDYLMILGATDVVPHQDLDNPVFKPGDDDDPQAWGDVPYACDAPYSRDPARFVGPTRVVGRLPDLTGATEPSYLIGLLKTAANYQRRSPDAYGAYFGLSTVTWQGSTRLSLNNLFGQANALLLSPPSGPAYPARQLGALTHFINCHGDTASPEFQGQKGNSYPIALSSQTTVGQIAKGTVAAAECCYGAELYDSVTLAIDVPICQSYLQQGAYGYFGSTTIAYGPVDDNGAADLICQHFLRNVLAGASVGRAALMARQEFVAGTAQMDPFDLKTLAQFYLLGDPSVHPVAMTSVAGVPKGTAGNDAQRFFRAERRAKLRESGEFLTKTKPTASKPMPHCKLSPATKTALLNVAKLAGLGTKQAYTAFAVKAAPGTKGSAAKAMAVPSRYLIAVGTPDQPKGKTINTKIKRGVAVVAKELNGRIVGYRIYHQR
jgi:Peptidase family C25